MFVSLGRSTPLSGTKAARPVELKFMETGSKNLVTRSEIGTNLYLLIHEVMDPDYGRNCAFLLM